MAKILNISQQAIGKWETGISTPSPETLITLADYFEISVDYLVGKTDIKRPIDSSYSDELKCLISEAEGLVLTVLKKFVNMLNLSRLKNKLTEMLRPKFHQRTRKAAD